MMISLLFLSHLSQSQLKHFENKFLFLSSIINQQKTSIIVEFWLHFFQIWLIQKEKMMV